MKLALAAVVLLLLHHYAIHPELHGLERFYQMQDMLNPRSHEFFINLALAAAATTSLWA